MSHSIRYKCDPLTETFFKIWYSFGIISEVGNNIDTDWNQINWKSVESRVFKLQCRIYRASQSGDISKVHKLQRLLLRSWYAKLLAIRRISQDNSGKNTAGIDGIKSLTPKQRLVLAENLTLNGKAKPLRRVWIPKPHTDEKRGLGIPTIEDRGKQALLKLALEPEWEAKFEPNSYGFRPGRSCHDAVEAIFLTIKHKSKSVLDADIAKCFDRINHQVLIEKLNTTPQIARQIKAWLKCGVLDRGDWFATNEGTPQGGVISPLLANIALHGLEDYLKQWAETWKGNKKKNQQSISLIRYADDFVVLHESKTIVQEAKELIKKWLDGLGLELKESKTKICHTLLRMEDGTAGFDFLGVNIRQYKVGKKHSGKNTHGKLLSFKTIIKPSSESVKEQYQKIVSVLDSMKGKSQEAVIGQLNPIIKGWSNYYATVCSKETFQTLNSLIYNKLRRWVKSRHPNKTHNWCKKKYWHRGKDERSTGDNWVFSTPSDEPNSVVGKHELWKHTWTPIARHIKVKGDKSPYDGDWLYWSARRGDYPDTPKRVSKLLKRQKGKCARCGFYFDENSILEVDHIIPKAEGGKDQYSNYQLLHRHCHHQKTAEDRQRQIEYKENKSHNNDKKKVVYRK